MTRTVCIKLLPTPEQAQALTASHEKFAQACAFVEAMAREHKCLRRYDLHHLAYYPCSKATAACSQYIILAMARVVSAYKTLKAKKRLPKDTPWPRLNFSLKSSVSLDARTFRLSKDRLSVGITTPHGRLKTVAVQLGPYQQALLEAEGAVPKEARLVRKRRRGVVTEYLHVSLAEPATPPVALGGALGVDVGENTIAATSSGKVMTAAVLKHHRDVYLARRRRLQRNGSQSAKQALGKTSGRERRHVRHQNHVVSKKIVEEARRQGASLIALEDLTHIRDSIRAGRRVRSRLHRWPFRQLQEMVAYKAQRAGIQVRYIDPAYTSQTCAACHGLGRRNQSHFMCACGHQRHADVNAASNIRWLGQPIGRPTSSVTAGHVAASNLSGCTRRL